MKNYIKILTIVLITVFSIVSINQVYALQEIIQNPYSQQILYVPSGTSNNFVISLVNQDTASNEIVTIQILNGSNNFHAVKSSDFSCPTSSTVVPDSDGHEFTNITCSVTMPTTTTSPYLVWIIYHTTVGSIGNISGVTEMLISNS